MKENNAEMGNSVKQAKKAAEKYTTLAGARRKETIFYIAVMALPILQFIIFYIIINFNSFLLAFQKYSGSATDRYFFVGFDNFAEMFDNLAKPNSILSKAIGTSLTIYALNWLVKPLQLLFPFYIYKKMPAYEFFRVILFLPQILSGTVLALLYKFIMDGGYVEVMDKLYGMSVDTGLITGINTRFWTIWIYQTFMGFGGLILVYTNNMSRIPASLVEYAHLEGCTPMQEFFKITFPLILPTFATYLLIALTSIFTADLGLYTFFGTSSDQDLSTVGYHLFCMIMGPNPSEKYAYASAVGLFFTLILSPLTVFFRWFTGKFFPATQY